MKFLEDIKSKIEKLTKRFDTTNGKEEAEGLGVANEGSVSTTVKAKKWKKVMVFVLVMLIPLFMFGGIYVIVSDTDETIKPIAVGQASNNLTDSNKDPFFAGYHESNETVIVTDKDLDVVSDDFGSKDDDVKHTERMNIDDKSDNTNTVSVSDNRVDDKISGSGNDTKGTRKENNCETYTGIFTKLTPDDVDVVFKTFVERRKEKLKKINEAVRSLDKDLAGTVDVKSIPANNLPKIFEEVERRKTKIVQIKIKGIVCKGSECKAFTNIGILTEGKEVTDREKVIEVSMNGIKTNLRFIEY